MNRQELFRGELHLNFRKPHCVGIWRRKYLRNFPSSLSLILLPNFLNHDLTKNN